MVGKMIYKVHPTDIPVEQFLTDEDEWEHGDVTNERKNSLIWHQLLQEKIAVTQR